VKVHKIPASLREEASQSLRKNQQHAVPQKHITTLISGTLLNKNVVRLENFFLQFLEGTDKLLHNVSTELPA